MALSNRTIQHSGFRSTDAILDGGGIRSNGSICRYYVVGSGRGGGKDEPASGRRLACSAGGVRDVRGVVLDAVLARGRELTSAVFSNAPKQGMDVERQSTRSGEAE